METTIESPLYVGDSVGDSSQRIEGNDEHRGRVISAEDMKSRLAMSSSFSHLNIQNPAALTIFLLVNTMIGSGILNQPHVFEASGLLGGLIGFIIAGY